MNIQKGNEIKKTWLNIKQEFHYQMRQENIIFFSFKSRKEDMKKWGQK